MTTNHPSNYRHKSFLIIVIALLAVWAFNENELAEQNASKYLVSGNVFSSEGSPLKNLEIRLYDAEDLGNPLADSKTKANGSFKIKVSGTQSFVMEVDGDTGAGRLFLSSDDFSNPLRITYPITEEIVILHTNDPHFDLNNVEELNREIEKTRKQYKDVFLFSAGDIFVRHPLRWVVNGKLMEGSEWYGERAMQMISTMNHQGYDLLTLGNHELGFVESYTRKALEAADFPILSANFEVTTDDLPSFKPYVILNTSTRRKIAVLGLSVDNTRRDGVRELDFTETVKKYLSLKDSSDVFIALTHIGYKRDIVLAQNFTQFDVIVGGHSHTLIEEAEMVNGVLVAQAGGNPHVVSDDHPVYLGKIILKLENGRIKEKKGWVNEIVAQEVVEMDQN
jgi:2',3'-cyclic-nucleotide 2'-phosphodiesterase (5'-nucleotidase family)